MFYLCRYDGKFIRWHSYKTETARDKWATIYRARGEQVQNDSSFFNTKEGNER